MTPLVIYTEQCNAIITLYAVYQVLLLHVSRLCVYAILTTQRVCVIYILGVFTIDEALDKSNMGLDFRLKDGVPHMLEGKL